MRITRTVTTKLSRERAFAYLSDFTTTTDWDPGTVLTTRLAGDGGLGTTYANTSEFNGRRTELIYEVIDIEPGHRIVLRGTNRTVTAVDTMTFTSTPEGGTTVTYDANFTFTGIARLAVPFLGGAFRKLGDEAEVGLQRTLDALAASGTEHV